MMPTVESSGRFQVSKAIVVIMIAGGCFFVGLAVGLFLEWLPMDQRPPLPALTALVLFGGFSIVWGMAMSSWKIDWDSNGLILRIPSPVGVVRRNYSWSDIVSVSFKRHQWRVECGDGCWFGLGLGMMTGAAPLLREMARRGIKSDSDILQSLENEERLWSHS